MPTDGILDVFPAPNGRKYPFFTSGDKDSTKAVVFIGGLFNGLGDVPYLPMFSEGLEQEGWRLVQMHWTSAYDNFGVSSLDIDVADLAALVNYLRTNDSVETVVIMGHSTGSQDVIRYLTTKGDVQGGIMQAPVSDREHFVVARDADSVAWRAALPRAQEMIASGKGHELVDGQLGIRITAYRLNSLMDVSGDDDYFSSDLPISADGKAAHPLDESFGKLTVPALALFSSKDEFAHVPDLPAMYHKWQAASNGHLECSVIADANHAVEDHDHQIALTEVVIQWLQKHFQ